MVVDPDGTAIPPQTYYVSAIVGSDLDNVLGEPVNADEGVRLAYNSSTTPDNDSILTVHLPESISDSLWVYSFATSDEQRFTVEVSTNSTDWVGIPPPYEDIFGTSYFANDNAAIPLPSISGGINYVRLHSLLPDINCTSDCNKFTQAMLVNAIAGTRAPAHVPVPATVWLFGSGLCGLFGIARRRRHK